MFNLGANKSTMYFFYIRRENGPALVGMGNQILTFAYRRLNDGIAQHFLVSSFPLRNHFFYLGAFPLLFQIRSHYALVSFSSYVLTSLINLLLATLLPLAGNFNSCVSTHTSDSDGKA